jgi:hypothetical protein
VKINVASGVVAFSALPITIDVTAEETVVLRGITLKSLTPGSGNGISVLAGDLIVEGSEVDGWNTGLYVQAASRVSISHSAIRNNVTPVNAVAGARLYLADSELFNNDFGVQINPGAFGRFSRLEISRGSTGIFCMGTCDVSDVRVWDKLHGIAALGGALIRLNRVEVTGCSVGGLHGPATWESYGNNAIRGNVADFANGAMLTPVALQ